MQQHNHQLDQPISFQQLFGVRPDAAQVIGARPPSVSKYDQTTVIRMGNQIATIMVDAAIPFSTEGVHRLVLRCIEFGVSTPRGVECMVKAAHGECFSNRERIGFIAEAIVWEYVSERSLTVSKEDVLLQAQLVANCVGDVPYDDVTLDLIQRTQLVAVVKKSSTDQPTCKPKPELINLLELEENHYRSVRNDNEFVISREFGIHPTSGEPMYGQWVLRNYHTGEFIDSDRYLNDITERNHFHIVR